MSGLSLLWNKNRVHLKSRITVLPTQDTIYIKDSEIVYWLYTSKFGQIMKHKPDSISIPKLVSLFTPPQKSDKIVGLYRSLKENTSKLILFSHFELIIFQLSQKALPEDCIIQRIFPNSSNFLYEANFKVPEFKLESFPLKSKYLINGKYLNEELDCEGFEQTDETLLKVSDEVVKYLGNTCGSVLSCTLEFLKDDAGFYLIDILAVREGVLLAGKEVVSCVSKSIDKMKVLSRPVTARTVTARSVSRSFMFTHQEADTSISMLINNTTTPRCFKLSYEFPNKSTQTQPTSCCSYNSSISLLKQSIQQAQHQHLLLSQQLVSVQQDLKSQLQALDTKWKEKCISLSQSLANRKINQQKRSNSRPREIKRLLL